MRVALWLRRQPTAHRKLSKLPLSREKGGLREGVDGTSHRALLDAADA